MVSETLRRTVAIESPGTSAAERRAPNLTAWARTGTGLVRGAMTPEAAMNLVCVLILSTFSIIVFAFFRPEAIDGVFYAAFAGWFGLVAYNLRAGVDADSRLTWMRRSGYTAAVLFGLAAISLPMNIGDKDYACMVACSVLMAPTAAIAVFMYLKTR